MASLTEFFNKESVQKAACYTCLGLSAVFVVAGLANAGLGNGANATGAVFGSLFFSYIGASGLKKLNENAPK